MVQVTIQESTAAHVRLLAPQIREKDKTEIRALGWEPHKALFYAYKRAVYRRTAFVDQEIAAMWGVLGTMIGQTGIPYLITSNAVEKAPVTFLKKYKREVKTMLQMFPRLENYVDQNYPEAIKVLEMCGFQMHEVQPMGPNKMPFIRYSLEG